MLVSSSYHTSRLLLLFFFSCWQGRDQGTLLEAPRLPPPAGVPNDMGRLREHVRDRELDHHHMRATENGREVAQVHRHNAGQPDHVHLQGNSIVAFISRIGRFF